jgi:hypothetical protein
MQSGIWILRLAFVVSACNSQFLMHDFLDRGGGRISEHKARNVLTCRRLSAPCCDSARLKNDIRARAVRDANVAGKVTGWL